MPENLSVNVLILGAIVFVLGLVSYFTNNSIEFASTVKQTSVTQRDVAIAEAKKNGKKEYTFTTNFIPGIGIINDPAAYKKAWEDQNKKEPNN